MIPHVVNIQGMRESACGGKRGLLKFFFFLQYGHDNKSEGRNDIQTGQASEFDTNQ